jgi:hypothetical protein
LCHAAIALHLCQFSFFHVNLHGSLAVPSLIPHSFTQHIDIEWFDTSGKDLLGEKKSFPAETRLVQNVVSMVFGSTASSSVTVTIGARMAHSEQQKRNL